MARQLVLALIFTALLCVTGCGLNPLPGYDLPNGSTPYASSQTARTLFGTSQNGSANSSSAGSTQQQNFLAGGILVSVEFAAPDNDGNGVRKSCLVDTGAEATVIDTQIATQLSLQQVGTASATGIGGSQASPVYAADVVFPQRTFSNLDVVGLNISSVSNGAFPCIIGRDVLSHATETYNGATNSFSLIFN